MIVLTLIKMSSNSQDQAGQDLINSIKAKTPEQEISDLYHTLEQVAMYATLLFPSPDEQKRLPHYRLERAIESAEAAQRALSQQNISEAQQHLIMTASDIALYVSEFGKSDEQVGTLLNSIVLESTLGIPTIAERKLQHGYDMSKISTDGIKGAKIYVKK